MTPYTVAQRLIGIHEIAGTTDHPFIQWALSLTGLRLDVHDEVPWCGGLVAAVAFLCGITLPRHAAMARAWLTVGTPIPLAEATPGYDIVILARGAPPAGHVGFFAGQDATGIFLLGGNQSDGVTVAHYVSPQVLGVRRLG